MKRIWNHAPAVLLVAGCLTAWRILAQPSSPTTTTSTTAWLRRDIGPTGLSGSARPTPTGWQIKGAGADIWGRADSFQFVYLPWDGDIQIVSRVVTVEKTDPWAKAGLMIRESLDPASPHALVAWTPEKGAAFIRRMAAAGASKDDGHQAVRMIKGSAGVVFQQRGSGGADTGVDSITTLPSPRWIKLVRQGNVFQAFDSADGISWDWLGSEQISMASNVYVGLAVTSHNPASLCDAVFDQVSVAAPPPTGSVGPQIGVGDGLLGLYFDDAAASAGPALQRVDPSVSFDWGEASPADGLGRNHFHVRWEGELEAQFTEPYALHVVSDDRARLWINGELLIDEWYEHGEQTSTAIIKLERGQRYLLRLEYFEDRGRALVQLLWSSPSTPRQIIPRTQLYSHITDQDSDGLPDLWQASHRSALQDPVAQRQQFEAGFDPAAQPQLLGAWLSQDIGRVGQEGSAESRDGNIIVRGSGTDIYANADAFHFVYQPWRGDGQIVTRIAFQDNTDPWAKAGVMARSDLSADAPHVTLALTPEHGLIWLKRESKAVPTVQPLLTVSPAQPWLKLIRRGSTFSAFVSSDGLFWDWLGSEILNADAGIYWGLAVCSHDNSRLGAAGFEPAAVSDAPPANPPHLRVGSGDGLSATYFDGITGRSVSRVDPAVDFDWDTDSPAEGIGPDLFSARWEGFLEPQSSETYGLHVCSDDGARLWLDGQLLIDAWADHGPSEQAAKLKLEAGRRYAIKLEYFERAGEAMARLLWSSPTLGKQPIPTTQLYSAESAAPSPDASPSTSHAPDALESQSADGAPSANTTEQAKPSLAPALALNPIVSGCHTVSSTAGSDALDRAGQWAVEGNSIYATGRRGWLDYELFAPSADVYQLQIRGASYNPFDLDSGFYLVLTVDGEDLDRVLLDAGPGRTGSVQRLTPWLKAGPHRVRVCWDNVRKGRSLQVTGLDLQALDGPDANQNGIKDWVEDKLARENTIESPATPPGPADSPSCPPLIYSASSPACIEGRGPFLGMMRIALANGQKLLPQAGVGDHWFVNIPLAADSPTDLEVSFQNGARTEKRRLVWKPTNLLVADDLLLRRGDSLLLTAQPPSAGAAPASDQAPSSDDTIEIKVAGTPQPLGAGAGTLPFRFDEAGAIDLTGTFRGRQTETRTIQATVLSASLGGSPVAWTGKTRIWSCPKLPAGAILETDPRLSLEGENQGQEGATFQLSADQPEDRRILARLKTGGPILDAATVRGVTIYGVSESGAFYGEQYEDGSRLVETAVAQTRVFPDVRVELRIIVAGVMFQDGSLVKRLRAADFDDTGLAEVYFVLPPGVQTSNCHIVTAYQGETLLGEY
jgi:PA14 domain